MRDTFSLQLNVTWQCNLRCRHCYLPVNSRHSKVLMSEEVFLSSLADAIAHVRRTTRLRVLDVSVIGGEPTLRGVEWFERVLPSARALLAGSGLQHSLRLVTNLVSRDAVAIANMFDEVGTSYDPGLRFSAETLANRWRANAVALLERGIALGVDVTVTSGAIETGARDILSTLYELGFRRMHMGFFIPSGAGYMARGATWPSHRDTSMFLQAAAQWYFEKRRHGSRDLMVSPIAGLLEALRTNEPMATVLCPIASGAVSVEPNGSLRSCVAGGGERCGTWGEPAFTGTLATYVATPWYRHRAVQAISPRGACGGCDFYPVCLGGCSVLHGYWDGLGECPGFRTLLKFLHEHADVDALRRDPAAPGMPGLVA